MKRAEARVVKARKARIEYEVVIYSKDRERATYAASSIASYFGIGAKVRKRKSRLRAKGRGK